MDDKRITIQDAFRGLDAYLLEQEEGHDIAKGLAEFKARIDQLEHNEHDPAATPEERHAPDRDMPDDTTDAAADHSG
jgi:single-stranded DNA-specific DHH superfamily exonuclease